MVPDGSDAGSVGAPRRLSLALVRSRSALPGKKALQIQSAACGKRFVLYLGIRRTRNFNKLSCAVLIGGITWIVIRCMMAINGENSVALDAWNNVAVSIRNAVQNRLVQDLIYQDSIANIWTAEPNITRDHFRQLVLSEAYAPSLVAMSGMSLIFRVIGQEKRAMLERDAGSESLRQACCRGHSETGSNCAAVAATGLFCSGANPRYQITQFGAGGKLNPAVGNDTTYLERVGQEEYMVVHMIEPFKTNAKVWGFNLLSSDARLAAWRSAMKTGKKTFTRRLNLVQSTGAEFGFLVWLPLFEESAGGRWITAMGMGSGASGLNAVGSVNGVYKAQVLLNQALRTTFSQTQLDGISVYLFDNAPELNGVGQFLAAYNAPSSSPHEAYKDSSMHDVIDQCSIHKSLNLEIATADVSWVVIACVGDTYLAQRRTIYPELTTAIGVGMLIMSTFDRLLGHPTVMRTAFYRMESPDVENGIIAKVAPA